MSSAAGLLQKFPTFDRVTDNPGIRMKGVSPRSVAILVAAATTLFTVLVVLGALYFLDVFLEWWFFPVLTFILFPLIFLLLDRLMERFIHHRIRLIYKTIHEQKGGSGPKEILSMDQDILSEVEDEVRNWAENKRDEIKKLKEQESFRRQFIGNVAHELKTPVFSIQGYILTLLEGAVDDPAINRKFLERASKGVDRMTHIIEDLDTIMQFESGQLQLNVQKVDLVKLTHELVDGLEIKARSKNIRLAFAEKYEKPILVKVDRGRIDQVLTNLITNSINYGKEGGSTEVRFFDMDEHVLVEVADDGIGIARDAMPHIFERFFRADKSRSRHEGGSGLGLAIVKHIIEAHDQRINVRSTEGKGTTFSFTLEKA